MWKKRLSILLSIVFLLCMIVSPCEASAKGSVKLSNTKMTITEGKSKQLRIRNNKKKVIWSITSGKDKIKLTKKSKNGVQITAKKSGKAVVRARIGNRNYSCRITVKRKKATKEKTLIVYFSMIDSMPKGADAVTHATPSIGNTESAAKEIQKQTGGRLFQIKTVKKYPVSHSKCSEIASEEIKKDARPELSTHVKGMEDYDVVYIGFPIWVYREPMAIRTFLEEYDFSGKTVIPFCTSMAVGIKTSMGDIKKLCPEAKVSDGLRLETEQEDFSKQISRWIKKNNNKK